MAGVMNNTARQFNLKGIHDGKRTVVRIAPGYNVVRDDHWKTFVREDGTGSKKTQYVHPFLQKLKDSGQVDFGEKQDDLEMEKGGDTKSKSKSEPVSTQSKK